MIDAAPLVRRLSSAIVEGFVTGELLASKGAALNQADKESRTPYVWAQGVFLATNSPVTKPSTMALLDRLTSGAASITVKKAEVKKTDAGAQ